MLFFQFFKFCLNGGILGVIAWGLQQIIYHFMDSNSSYAYAAATCITFIPLVIVNFIIQRTIVFKVPGLFWRFLGANMVIMLIVSVLSFFCKGGLDVIFGGAVGSQFGFILANLMAVIPSFALKKLWVFKT